MDNKTQSEKPATVEPTQRGRSQKGNVNQIIGTGNQVNSSTNFSVLVSISVVLLFVLGGAAYFWLNSKGDGFNMPVTQPTPETVSPDTNRAP